MSVLPARLAITGLIAGLLLAALPMAPAAAQNTYEVVVGSRLKGAPAEANSFFPGDIAVHQGDTLHFTSDGFHTATLLPAGQNPEEWVESNASKRTAQTYSIFQTDPDEGEHAYKASTALLLPSRFDCGGPDQDPCEFDGSQPSGSWRNPAATVLNSGAPIEAPLDFSVTITADPGTELWAICLVHSAHMYMRIEVVEGDAESSDQAAIDQTTAKALASAARQAAALHKKYSRRLVQRSGPGSTRIYDTWVGIDTQSFSLLDIYPSKLAIKPGDTIRWNFDLLSEDHTASFPDGQALDIANAFPEMKCDLDTDSGPLPDQDPFLPPPLFCPGAFYQLELDFPADFVDPVGDGSFEGDDFESSGVRGPESEEAPYEVVFPAPMKDAITVVCMIHPFMDQTIQVR